MTNAECIWSAPPPNSGISTNEVHVWRAFLNQSAARMRSLRHTLAPDELERADRFYFQEDRQQFIIRRALLRDILSRYLDVAPSNLRFSYNDFGKPALAHPSSQVTLSFNLSHSHGLALYAITCKRRIGIDLERTRDNFEYEQIAERFFSSSEKSAISALPEEVKQDAFFNCWTRKEAYLKARGEGLTIPLDQFDVSLVPGEPALLLKPVGDPQESSSWSLKELSPGSGYVAAVAVEGNGWGLTCWQWSE